MGAVVFVDTSAFVAILVKEPEWRALSNKVAVAERCLTSPIVRLETSIVLGSRLLPSPREAERQLQKLMYQADVEEIAVDPAVGPVAVACFERYGKGRHPARLNFADCLSYACAKANRAFLLFKGEDFAKTDVNSWI
ncbi:MAG TPA: type II toxin-antitoxin system VapC family toxin [Roseiarcus sp.]|nr:type II toxin-antitoxin system VapC family toxin [Roseiarcus sp.]